MNRIAVDIVLLPDEAMTARAIEVNQTLDQSASSRIVLHEETCLPHISLAMGCIDPGDVRAIEGVLKTLADESSVRTLAVTGVVTSLNSRGESVSAFAVAMTPALKTLHMQVMEALGPYVTYDATEEMFYGSEEVAHTSLQWVRNFREKAAFGAFFPHITIGYGAVQESMRFPIEVAASRLALCHLGNHCTCRKVLAGVEI